MSRVDPVQHYAYPEQFKELEAVMRFAAVKRWHMVETRKTQTLAEHSANVAALAYVMATNCPIMYFGHAGEILPGALFHDMPEVFTGDIPTPSKRWLDKDRLDLAEQTITPRIFIVPLRDDQKMMVKICDLCDSIRHIRLHAVDLTGRHAMEGLEMQLFQKYVAARARWPIEVYSHVLTTSWFYAYETRDPAASAVIPADVWALENDMARGQGSQPGGAGRIVRDERRKL
jgi:hypothetical protein